MVSKTKTNKFTGNSRTVSGLRHDHGPEFLLRMVKREREGGVCNLPKKEKKNFSLACLVFWGAK